MFYNKEHSPFARYFGGGGGGSTPKLKAPAEQQKTQEVRRIEESAGEARKESRKRVPPGRKSTIQFGIQKVLNEYLG